MENQKETTNTEQLVAATANPETVEIEDVTKIDMITPLTTNHYLSFRGALSKAIEDAVTSGNALYDRRLDVLDGLVGVKIDKRILGFDTWRNTLHPTRQQHYNCDKCRATWEQIFAIAEQQPDGTIQYPAVKALLAAHRHGDPVIENLFRNAPNGAQGFKDYLTEASKPTPNGLFPLTAIQHTMSEGADKDGWDHFNLGNLDVIMNYNESRVPANDVDYVDNLYKRLVDTRFDGEAFAKLCVTIRRDVLEKQSETFSQIDGSALSRYPDLIEIVEKIRLFNKVSKTGLVFLHWSLGRSANGYLRHLNSSVLGNAFDAYFDLLDNPNDFDGIMAKVIRIMSRAVDSANYKNKVAEAKPATLEQAYKFLQENNLATTLLRRLVDIDEVRNTVWRPTVQAPSEVVVPAPVNTLDDAFKTVMAGKDTQENRVANLSEKLGLRVDRKHETIRMSTAAFVAKLEDIALISLPVDHNARVQPYLATTSIDNDVDHSKLLRFHGIDVDHGLQYTTPAAVSAETFAFSNINENLEVISTNLNLEDRNRNLVVTAVFPITDSDDRVGYIANIPSAGATVTHMFRGNGTAIIPSTIQGDHYGMSKAFQELSAKFKLSVKEGCTVNNAVGGVYIYPGMTFDVVYKDGRSDTVYLSSHT